jgi:hypothetical protein
MHARMDNARKLLSNGYKDDYLTAWNALDGNNRQKRKKSGHDM